MKKVGLVTYYGENYGGMLQAYALQRYVRELGYDCGIISNDFMALTSADLRRLFFERLWSFLKDPADYLKRRKLMRRFAPERAQKSARFQEFLTKHIRVDRTGYTTYAQYQENPPVYDVYLCGSDQIWNPNLFHEHGFYFADFAPAGAKRVSYASSIGVSSVTAEQAAFMKPYLEKLDVISTREHDGTAIVQQLTGKPARTVIDPTLLLDARQWSEVAAEPLLDEPYVFCYFFGERPYYSRIKQQVRELTGLQLVSIPYVARELAEPDVKIFDAGPAEFISLIKHAKLVLTDSFHATAFSVNFGTPFLSLARFAKNDAKGMNSRLHTILGTMELTDRLIDENDTITADMLYAVDFEKVHERLDRLRKEDGSFLHSALQD